VFDDARVAGNARVSGAASSQKMIEDYDISG
jgi:hypothetical protein